jgi:hypothetical protein
MNLMVAFDVIKHEHEAMPADKFNEDIIFKQCLNKVDLSEGTILIQD